MNLSLRPVAGWEGENIHDPGSEGPERNKGQRLRINYRRRLAAGEQEKLLSLNSNHVIPCSINPSNQAINDVMDLVLVYFFLECSIPKGNSTTVA